MNGGYASLSTTAGCRASITAQPTSLLDRPVRIEKSDCQDIAAVRLMLAVLIAPPAAACWNLSTVSAVRFAKPYLHVAE